ncbi:MAG: AAA family ATPase [Candidatus Levybacteria bacterium]|nr:AAA family ATPase [Candidatus Levybacteria bacterium]
MKIEINTQFEKALAAMDAGRNIFITGKAGTGKSTLLEYFRNKTEKNIVVLAPTGVAAVNVRGQTIHSFFRFRPDITLEKVKQKYRKIQNSQIYKKIDALVIDEISMVRADLLDCVDAFLRLHGKKKNYPFGGIQIIFIGDLYQLPPVVVGQERKIFSTLYKSPYFFDSQAFPDIDIEIIELDKIYRQKDEVFIRILNAVRNRSIDMDLLEILNRRVNHDFEPDSKDFFIHLVTTNNKAFEINMIRLGKLPKKAHSYHGEVSGEFDEKSLPAPLDLTVKVGAQIMLTNNDREGRWVNGTVGLIIDIKKEDEIDAILVKLETGETVDVFPYRWETFKFSYNDSSRKIESATVGFFTQYPLILAWAITIHKSQGKTFQKAVVDLGQGTFAHGQAYVALSRCVSLEGLVLKNSLEKKHVLLDWRIVKFLTQFHYKKSEEEMPLEEKTSIIQKAIKDKTPLEILYLKSSDEKSRRVVKPYVIGEMNYQGRQFLGFSGFDELRGQDRVFRVDRILEIKTKI